MTRQPLPNYLFHAAPQCVRESIEAEGLRANYGEVYAAGSIAEALTFMWFRILDHPHHAVTEHKKTTFELVAHDEIHVWGISTKFTGKRGWQGGTDHASLFFGGASSYVYQGNIAPEALTLHVITREEIEQALGSAKTQKLG